MNLSAIEWTVYSRPESLNEGVSDPVEHSANGDEGIFHIRAARISRRSITSGDPAADKVQSGNDAFSVEIGSIVLSQYDFSAILKHCSGHLKIVV